MGDHSARHAACQGRSKSGPSSPVENWSTSEWVGVRAGRSWLACGAGRELTLLGGSERRGGEARRAVCQAWRLRSEVEVLTWGPDRGNPTSMRQGRGSEFTGRSQCGCLRCGASVRAGLKEAIDVSWSRTRVKRRKASFGWVSWPPAAMPGSCRSRGRIGDVIAAKSQRLTLGDLLGSSESAGRPENERTTADGPAEVGGSRSTGRRGNAR